MFFFFFFWFFCSFLWFLSNVCFLSGMIQNAWTQTRLKVVRININQILRPVARGYDTPPKSAKRSTFSYKMGQKWGFCRRVKGVRFKKSTFWVQKVHFLGVPHPPKIDPGYGPANTGHRLLTCKFSSNLVGLLQVLRRSSMRLDENLHVRSWKKETLFFLGGGMDLSSPGGVFTYLAEQGCAALMGRFFTKNP